MYIFKPPTVPLTFQSFIFSFFSALCIIPILIIATYYTINQTFDEGNLNAWQNVREDRSTTRATRMNLMVILLMFGLRMILAP